MNKIFLSKFQNSSSNLLTQFRLQNNIHDKKKVIHVKKNYSNYPLIILSNSRDPEYR